MDDLKSTAPSRRAYGWQVPADKKVFLEGDVRIDLKFVSMNKIMKTKSKNKVRSLF